MPRAGETIEHPLTGERITFVDLGDPLVLESVWTRAGHRAAEHVHPAMEERFDVLEGVAAFRVAGREQTVGAGGTVVVPPGTPHEAWSPGEVPVRLRMTFTPALRWAAFVERWFADPEALPALVAEFRDEVAPAA